MTSSVSYSQSTNFQHKRKRQVDYFINGTDTIAFSPYKKIKFRGEKAMVRPIKYNQEHYFFSNKYGDEALFDSKSDTLLILKLEKKIYKPGVEVQNVINLVRSKQKLWELQSLSQYQYKKKVVTITSLSESPIDQNQLDIVVLNQILDGYISRKRGFLWSSIFFGIWTN